MCLFDKPPRYRSFLLVVWEERSRDPQVPAVWRFRLEDARTGKRRGFVSLEEVMAFIQTELADWQNASPPKGRS